MKKELFWLLALDAVMIAVVMVAACIGYVIWKLFFPFPDAFSVIAYLLCCLIAPVVYLLCLKSKSLVGAHIMVSFLLRGINFIFVCIFSVYFYFWFGGNVFHLIW
jgi:hypothetical protein